MFLLQRDILKRLSVISICLGNLHHNWMGQFGSSVARLSSM